MGMTLKEAVKRTTNACFYPSAGIAQIAAEVDAIVLAIVNEAR